MRDHLSRETTFAVATLGCKVNQADSEAIGEQLSAAGFVQRDFHADVYIVNTCTVTHLGDRSSRQMISQARRRHPDALLVVTGCYAELNPQAVAALPGVDLVIGNSGKESLAEAILQRQQAPIQNDHTQDNHTEGDHTQGDHTHSDRTHFDHTQGDREGRPYHTTVRDRTLPMVPFDTQHIGSDRLLLIERAEAEPQPDNPSHFGPLVEGITLPVGNQASFTSRTRVQMKVQDGCDNRCTYCIVPSVRGKSRSRSIASVVEHVRRKTRAGFHEVVLTGIHLGDYHPEGDEQRDLGNLVATLLRETAISRIRVSSLEPEDFRLEWLELWENPRMCRHLHLPMQSGSDTILRRMARHYNSNRYHTIVTTAKRLVPGIAISTDIITGFPGESEADFEQTYQLAAELQFAKAHIFRFSPRQGTAAARMKGQIAEEVKKARSERLLALNEEHGRLFRQQFLGETMQVLVEQSKVHHWEGLTDNYVRVELAGLPEAETRNWQNTLVNARLDSLVSDGVLGVVVL